MKLISRRRKQHTDAGMTLPELLVSVTLTAILASSLAVATNVMLSNRDNTIGRANNSRSEQNVGLFMPTDLASSESENTDPWSTACVTAGPDAKIGTPDDVAAACPPGGSSEGSNALLLTWTSSTVIGGTAVKTTTLVSYRVVVVGTEYQLIRVKCDYVGVDAPTCNTQIVLHDLTPPGPGVTFVPGVTKPDWIITVSKATAPDDPNGPTGPTLPVDPGLKNKNGQRVVVTVNGGGGGSSASGGQSQIFLSAGGTDRNADLSTEDLTGAPTFTAARSRCGGNIGMIVDTSNSIWNSQMATIKGGIRSFLDEFAGTPVKLEIVTFSTTGTILGSSAGEPKWFDMLVDSDVTALKNLIGDPAQSGNLGQKTGGSPTPVGIQQNGGTNWEDGFLRMLKNKDGSVPAQLPSKVIFFTDGVPTYDRSADDNGNTHSSSTAPITVNPLDAGLPLSTGNSYSQVAWNRAERVVRDRGKVDVIGVFVGALPPAGPHTPNTADDSTSDAWEAWTTASAGYHWSWARLNNLVYQRGYHLGYQRNANVVWERGGNSGPFVGNKVVYERGFHATTPQRNNNVVFERSSSGLTYERFSSGSWSTTSTTTYFTNNTTPDETDNYRVRVTGTVGSSWVTTDMTQTTYDATNVDDRDNGADGFRTRLNGSLSGSWTTVTAAQFGDSNTTTDSSDGWKVASGPTYTSPYDGWEPATQSAYSSGNTNNTSTDGWRVRQTAPSTSFVAVSSTLYTNSNTTSDDTDGWSNLQYVTPYNTWVSTTQTLYDGNNSTTDQNDGWRTRVNGSLSATWTDLPSIAPYTASNTTADSTDGWRVNPSFVYSAPFDSWENSTQALYDANNTTSATTDGWRTQMPGVAGAWVDTTQTYYDRSNLDGTDNDGWRTYKNFSAPFSNYDITKKDVSSIDLLGNVIVGDLSGNTGSYNRVDAPASGSYPDDVATAADVFALPNYTYFADALDKIVLGECGGTVTLQTKNVLDGQGAKDPFTYSNSSDNTVVKTSSAFKSGTFDIAFPGENAKTITIAPQEYSNLTAWTHYDWKCKSKGVDYPFTENTIPGSSWTSITLTVHANEAISCIQRVTYHG
jgi:prepilin-type N-terminal cleavage/methylation domain-containing protein